MSDLKAILDATKKIESILEKQFGGNGRGMHEKLNSSTRYIPEHLIKRVRYIASVRNKAVHEDGYDIEDASTFLKTCLQTAQELEEQAKINAEKKRKPASTTSTHARAPGHHATAHPGMSSEKKAMWGAVAVVAALFLSMLYLFVTGAGKSTLPMATEIAAEPVRTSKSAAQPVHSQGARQDQNEKSEPPKKAPPPQRSNQAAGEQEPGRSQKSAASAAPPQEEPEVEAREPISISKVSIRYGQDGFKSPEAQVTATFTNHTGKTLSNLQVMARLYLNGESSPVMKDGSGGLFVHMGDRGLLDGDSRTVTMTAGRMSGASWISPDALNAITRRVAIAVIGYTDGSQQRVKFQGSYVSSPEVKTGNTAQPAAAPQPGEGPLLISGASLRYGKDGFNHPEAKVSLTVTNNTAATIAHASLGARVFINGEATPVLGGRGQKASLFASLGANGLKAGETRTLNLQAGRMADRAWVSPDLLNASSYRIELWVQRYTDGRNQTTMVGEK